MEYTNNIQSFKGRTINVGDKVKVYFDLRSKIFSIQIGQLVHGKAEAIVLKNATFRVNEKNRLRVVATGEKNVHAKVHGEILWTAATDENELLESGFREATYNPYKYDSFVDKETKYPIKAAKWVQLQGKRIFYKI